MPQVLRKSHNSGVEIIVWELLETQEFFLENLGKDIYNDPEFINTNFEHKKLELLGARFAAKVLVSELGYDFAGIAKDEYGKPYLKNSAVEMSLTHTKKYVAVCIHPKSKLGVDLEAPSKKMWRIKDRLFSEQEIRDIGDDINLMSIYWSSKEAMYKLYGKRGMHFVDNMRIEISENRLLGFINMPDFEHSCEIFHEKFKEFILVWAV